MVLPDVAKRPQSTRVLALQWHEGFPTAAPRGV